ncbi:immunoglobulin domain protein [Ancylostoma ceylanicum]|uniref:Immunoglobulin domain protein n=1 Tax=Ancylostoma ceylanicum TaxID=53326 RepID=A0A0D6MD41_9BILA|nr:immunoglobulin domain protein [Ancylostoma ceylanicum]
MLRSTLYFPPNASFALLGMRCSPLIFTLLLHLCTAWEVVVTPNGDRLLDQRTGDNFMVACKVKDYDGAASDVKVEWYKNGNVVSRMGSIMTIYKTYANQLLINRPKISDSGDYVCKAEVDGEEKETSVRISFADPPKFINPETEQHPEEGSTAEIVCNVEGTEKLEVFWQFNGTILEEGSPRGYEFQNDRQILMIPEYDSKKDDGIYNCNAAQFSSFETLAINVTGYSRPVITVFDTPDNNIGFEGASAKIQCGAVGKPKPQYQWFDKPLRKEMGGIDSGLTILRAF